jgi:hypothetical protein
MSENTLNKIEQTSSVFKPEIKSGQVLEHSLEQVVEKSALEKKAEQEGSSKPEVKEVAATVTSTAPSITDDYHKRREVEIDAYLSEGLSETFLAMPPAKQKIFKEEGELAAKKINVLLDATKVNVGKIITIIKNWLKIITGINRFFLDQEAKIKADKIIKMKNKL